MIFFYVAKDHLPHSKINIFKLQEIQIAMTRLRYFLLRQNSTIDNQLLAWIFRWYRVTHIQCREGLHTLPKKWPHRWKISRIRELKNYYKWHKRERNRSNIVFGRAWSPSLHKRNFATFLLGQNSTIDNQAFVRIF